MALDIKNTEITKTTYSVKFELIYGAIGQTPTSFDTNRFDTLEDCYEYWFKECKTRDKKDGHDAYWHTMPFMYQRVETNTSIHIM